MRYRCVDARVPGTCFYVAIFFEYFQRTPCKAWLELTLRFVALGGAVLGVEDGAGMIRHGYMNYDVNTILDGLPKNVDLVLSVL